MSKTRFFLSASSFLISAQTFSAKAEIVETLAMSPTVAGQTHIEKAFTRPTRSWVPFGGSADGRSNSAGLFVGRYGVSSIPLQETILRNTINVSSVPVCGPSPTLNTLACHNSSAGELLKEFPIPGNLSTQPVFFDGSWFFGTSKGFFVRTEGTSLLSTPLLGGEQTGYWGSASRSQMKALKPLNSLDAPEKDTDPRVAFRKLPRPGWRWYATTSAEFVGTPLFLGSQILVLTAQQFLLSLDAGTGKTLWSVRLAPEASLRIEGRALTSNSKEVLVGTEEGQLMAINPKDGAVLWRHLMTTTGRERFRSIVAPPTASGRSVFVSNAETQTIRLSLDGKTVEWTYPLGSVAQTRVVEDALLIGGHDGTLVSLDARTGALRWKILLSPDAPLASIYWGGNSPEGSSPSSAGSAGSAAAAFNGAQRGADSGSVLAADKKGRVFQVRLKDGRLLDSTTPQGEVVGEFFRANNETCLSYTINGFRCFVGTTSVPRQAPFVVSSRP